MIDYMRMSFTERGRQDELIARAVKEADLEIKRIALSFYKNKNQKGGIKKFRDEHEYSYSTIFNKLVNKNINVYFYDIYEKLGREKKQSDSEKVYLSLKKESVKRIIQQRQDEVLSILNTLR